MPLTKDILLKSIEELKKNSPKRNFKQSIELIIKLKDIDLKKPEARITDIVELPHPIKKQTKICVIADGELAIKAKNSGADSVIGKNDLNSLASNKKEAKKFLKDYDFFIAEASLMPLIGKTIGPILGPRGKMPTPVPLNAPIDEIIKRYRKTIRIRTKDQPQIQCIVATEDAPDEEIVENIQAVISKVESKLEKGLKNIAGITLKKTMGHPIKIKI
ncbi:MAG: 50S ribosomal protein L1 [Candidatus Bathyarchaeia archaeon]